MENVLKEMLIFYDPLKYLRQVYHEENYGTGSYEDDVYYPKLAADSDESDIEVKY